MSKDKSVEKLKKELGRAKSKAEEYLNGWKRARADYINREREIEEEKARWIKFANSELIFKLLVILDSFNQSLVQLPEDLRGNQWVKGILQIKAQFEDFLCAQGVEKIKTIDEKFNPSWHEVVEKRAKEGGKLQNVIIKEVQAGYKMHGKLIRLAKVIIK